MLLQHHMRARATPRPPSASARAARSTRLSASAASAAGKRPCHSQRQRLRGFRTQHVTDPGERHEAVEQMVSVVAAAGHMQVEIDLGRRRLGQAIRPQGYWPLTRVGCRSPLQLRLQLRRIVRLGIEGQRAAPLKRRLQLAPRRPVGIAEMAVDRRVLAAPVRPRAPASSPRPSTWPWRSITQPRLSTMAPSFGRRCTAFSIICVACARFWPMSAQE